MIHAVGGGPEIVRDGVPVYRAFEAFTADQLSPRNPRTAVGQLRDGSVILVVVDGRRPGYSAGVTNFELGQTVARLGAVEAMALDAGGSSTMAFDGQLLNRPSDPGGERAVAEALLVSYYGVYAPPPAVQVLSPNGDGVGERQALSYKVVRPSTVTARLVGPERSVAYTRTAELKPGRYALRWSGRDEDGSAAPEGRWDWVVTAVDDQDQSSAINRGFWLNRTLGFLRVTPSTLRLRPRGRPLVVNSKLSRRATVTLRVETSTGAVVRTLQRRAVGPGRLALRWNGRDDRGNLVRSGSYVARVSSTNSFGRADLTRRFSVRRVAKAH
jgi:flagellar hook assembly protein FlgD